MPRQLRLLQQATAARFVMDPEKPTSVDAPLSARAAQYIRMSTEHQKYSTANQADAIARYAAARGMAITRTYEDSGKSGLRLDGRIGIQQLIADVRAGTVDFSVVLVYDVSRWGRFQDADESAYYEFICKEAGIAVHYCAEQFENDGSLSATLIKSMKRVMAGEYSRELSAKVFAGQCRLIGLGFRQGGSAGFGLRRQLLDEHRQPKELLGRGQRKSLQTDRVVLVPGPDHEVEVVRQIYQMFIGGMTEQAIATALNTDGVSTDFDRAWTRGTVRQVLTNEKYVGNNVYNRRSFKLKNKHVANPPEMWIRATGVFPSIVSIENFVAAQERINARTRHFSDADMLSALKMLFQRHGRLSSLLIDEQESMACSAAYRSRFGGLIRAYQLVGYVPSRDVTHIDVNKALRRLHPTVVERIVTGIRASGGNVTTDPDTETLQVNGEFSVCIVISRCQTRTTGRRHWRVRFDSADSADITIVVRMDESNSSEFDYYILPRVEIDFGMLRLADENGWRVDAYRSDSLDPLFALAARTSVEAIA